MEQAKNVVSRKKTSFMATINGSDWGLFRAGNSIALPRSPKFQHFSKMCHLQ